MFLRKLPLLPVVSSATDSHNGAREEVCVVCPYHDATHRADSWSCLLSSHIYIYSLYLMIFHSLSDLDMFVVKAVLLHHRERWSVWEGGADDIGDLIKEDIRGRKIDVERWS